MAGTRSIRLPRAESGGGGVGKGHKAWVVLGAARSAPEGVCNSALLYNRAGQLAGVYDKVHCRGHDRKSSRAASLPVFDCDFGCSA